MVNVFISSDSKFPASRAKIKAAVESVLKAKNVSSDVEVSVLVCGTRKSAELAKKYLDDDSPHDVLSFPLLEDVERNLARPFVRPGAGKGFVARLDGILVLGDIVVCYPLAQEEANDDNVLVDTKITELVSHGMLHLLGEHHE